MDYSFGPGKNIQRAKETFTILMKFSKKKKSGERRGADVLFLEVVKSLSDTRIDENGDDDDDDLLSERARSSSSHTEATFILAGI